MHSNSNGITIHAEFHPEPADGDLHTAIYGPTTERARLVAASAHYYCMILELQRLIAALISYGSAADSSNQVTLQQITWISAILLKQSEYVHFRFIDHSYQSKQLEPDSDSVGTDEAIDSCSFPGQYLMHSKIDTQ